MALALRRMGTSGDPSKIGATARAEINPDTGLALPWRG